MLPLLIAAGAGLASGIGNSMGAAADARNQRQAINSFNQSANNLLNDYGMQGQNAINNYQEAMQANQADPSRVNTWLDPSMKFQMDQAAKANAQAFGAQGKLNSGARMMQLNDRNMGIASQGYQNAVANMNAANNYNMGLANNLMGAQAGLAGNLYSGGMQNANNVLAAKMGQTSPSAGDFFSGFGSGMNMVGGMADASKSILNAFS